MSPHALTTEKRNKIYSIRTPCDAKDKGMMSFMFVILAAGGIPYEDGQVLFKRGTTVWRPKNMAVKINNLDTHHDWRVFANNILNFSLQDKNNVSGKLFHVSLSHRDYNFFFSTR